jgi:hypothetical protein
VAFGPKGTKWENALAVSDNGSNDLRHRRVANGAERLSRCLVACAMRTKLFYSAGLVRKILVAALRADGGG